MNDNSTLSEAAGSLDPKSAMTPPISIIPTDVPCVVVPIGASPPSPDETDEPDACEIMERVIAATGFAGLSDPQRAALRAIGAGKAREVILQRAGISSYTLTSRTSDPLYTAAREVWRAEVWESVQQRMRDLIPRARAAAEERRKNSGKPPKPKTRKNRENPKP